MSVFRIEVTGKIAGEEKSSETSWYVEANTMNEAISKVSAAYAPEQTIVFSEAHKLPDGWRILRETHVTA